MLKQFPPNEGKKDCGSLSYYFFLCKIFKFLIMVEILDLGTKMHMKNINTWLKNPFSYLHIIWMEPPRVLVHVLT
jgi:hypothetical protein